MASESPLTLALDTGSPVTSVAMGRGGRVIGSIEAPGGRSSGSLLGLIDRVLRENDPEIGDVVRILAARGPGSFTGLRVGLATVLGLHQSLRIQATAVSTFRALARQARVDESDVPVVAVVDALRGEWFAKVYSGRGVADQDSEARILGIDDLLAHAPCRLAGFGLDGLPDTVKRHPGIDLCPASALARTFLEIAENTELAWEPERLTQPLYLRPPAATPPAAKTRASRV